MISLLLLSLPLVIQISLVHYLQKFYSFVMPTGVADGDSFDFIVVGAGSAGSAFTGRLVEKGYHVLLVEAGGPPHYLQKIPGNCFMFMTKPGTYSWPYVTTPQKDALKAFPNNQLRLSHGKSLGGSSMLNFMLYVRGNTKDYDEWESLGNPGWGWKDVYPYFKRSEFLHNVDKTVGGPAYIDMDKHGSSADGRLHVMPTPELPPYSKVVGEAAQDMGYSYGDYNGNSQDEEIIYRAQKTVKEGLRADSYSSYIANRGLEQRDNFKVLDNGLVTRVLLDKDNNAIGIEVKRFGETTKYYANKEVVLSAGAIGSPKILLHSGIGPKEHLKEVGVEARHDLPGVGSNLQDHLFPFMVFRSQNVTGLSKNIFEALNPLKMIKYVLDRKGDLLSNSGIESGLFAKTSFQPENGDKFQRTDIQIHSAPVGPNADYGQGFALMTGQSIDQYKALFKVGSGPDFESNDTLALMPTLLRPKSRGTIRLASSDPKDLPLIDPRYLSHPDDVETLAAGLHLSYSFQETPTFKKHQLVHLPDTLNCGDYQVGSLDYFRCFARHHSHTVWHFSGSCKMGRRESDPMAVVDHRLRVHGIKGLRVVDASIMPRLVGANTNAPAVMIGDKASDLIHEDWQNRGGNHKAAATAAASADDAIRKPKEDL